MTASIENQLGSYIASEILKDPNRNIAANEALITSGLIDSFSLVDMALFIEGTYGVRIDDTELTADVFDTIEELAAIVAERQMN